LHERAEVFAVLFEKLARHGAWLFRWRSFMPLLLAPIIIGAMLKFTYPYGSPLIDDMWEMVCALVAFLGLAIRGYTVGHAPPGTSGGNTREQRAVSLNITGSYSVVRHPLYVGNYFMWLGVAMFTESLTVVAIFSLVFWIYYERIMMAEEAFLNEQFGETFRQWAARTPAFLPDPRLWRAPATPVNWRIIVRREYSGAFAVVVIFSLLEFIGDSAADGMLEFEPGWVAILSAASCIYLAIMYLKRCTHLLDLTT
jgi:protein-S-isoprenylcysteine O-methyltransferase Ste14